WRSSSQLTIGDGPTCRFTCEPESECLSALQRLLYNSSARPSYCLETRRLTGYSQINLLSIFNPTRGYHCGSVRRFRDLWCDWARLTWISSTLITSAAHPAPVTRGSCMIV